MFLIASIHHSFSQIGLKKNLIPVDSVPLKLPDLKNVRSSFKNDLDRKLFDSIRFIRSSVLSAAKKIYQDPFKLVNLKIDYRGLADSSYLYNGNQYYLGDFDASASWLIFGIPVTINYQNESWSDAGNFERGRFSFQYDRNNYLDQLRKKLGGKLKPSELLKMVADPLLDAKQNAEKLLRNDLAQVNGQYKGLLNETINKIGDPATLFNKEISSLRQQLLNNDYIKSIREKENLYSQLLQKRNSGEAIDINQLKSLENSLLQVKGTEALINKIEEHKHKWESSGLIKKMKEWDLFQKEKIMQLMKNPGTTINAAKQYLNLNSLQKLFLKIDKLKMGQNAYSLSPLSIQHFLNKGVVSEFLNNKNSFMLLLGKQQDYSSLLDIPFANNIFSNAGFAKSIGFGTGRNSSSHSHISLASYDQILSSVNIPAALNSFRRSLVTTLSHDLTLGKNGSISTEISRSAMEYPDSKNGTGESGFKKMLSMDNFWDNTAFSVKYEDEYSRQNLSYEIHASKTANGYNNPGDIFLNAGSKELGYKLRKLFWNRRLQLNMRTDLREFKYNDEKDDRWRSFYSVFDIKWKMKKGQYAGLRYMPNKMIRLDGNLKSTLTEISRLTAEANLSKKIAGAYYRNYMNLSFQKNGYSFNHEWISATTLLFSSSQTVSIGKNMIYVNTNYNYANNHSQYVFFNSSLVSEAGSSYILFKKINATSSLTYNAIDGWYKQVGIRQNLSAQIGERFNMNVYVDARKNIRVYQPLWFGLLRADVSIHYQLKN